MPILSHTEQAACIERLEQFLAAMPFDRIAADVATAARIDNAQVAAMLETYANESRVSLQLILPELNRDLRLLEVGAGLCFTSLFLTSEGYRITALEPALGGFGLFEQLRDAVLRHAAAADAELELLTIPAQQLDPARHGRFDLIFSNNVIEHIPDWQDALGAMAAVLTPRGHMKHACPNYSVPYEPHYGVPVLRRLPQLSRSLFLSADADPEIWESLNFITCREVRNYCRIEHLSCCFEKGLLYKALSRIDNDPLFRERHRGVIAATASWGMRSGLGALLRRLPPAMATPMIFEIRHGG